MLGYLAYRGARGASREFGRTAKQFAKSSTRDKRNVFILATVLMLAFAVMARDTSFLWAAGITTCGGLACHKALRRFAIEAERGRRG